MIKAPVFTIARIFKLFFKHPFLIIPLVFLWAGHFFVDLYIRYSLLPTFLGRWSDWLLKFNFLPYLYLLLTILAIYYIYALILSFSCCLGVYSIKDYSERKTVDIAKATRSTIALLPEILFMALILSTVLILYSLYQIYLILTGVKKRSLKPFKQAGKEISSIKKHYRMVSFILFPAIVFEKKSFKQSYLRAKEVLHNNFKEFNLSTDLMNGVHLTILIPIIIILIVNLFFSWQVSLYVVFLLAFLWSFSMYMEQMYSTLFFMWSLKYEEEKKKNPRITKENVPKPGLLSTLELF